VFEKMKQTAYDSNTLERGADNPDKARKDDDFLTAKCIRNIANQQGTGKRTSRHGRDYDAL
jgi:hypothetical protein